MNMRLLLLVCLSLAMPSSAVALHTPARHQRVSSTATATRAAALMLATKPKKKKSKPKSSGGGGGFGAPTVAAAGAARPTDKELLKKSMDLYEQLEVERERSNRASAEDQYGEGAEENSENDDEPADSLTQYAITMRSPGTKDLGDWVPVAILAVKCGAASQPAQLVASALGASMRCVLEAGCQSYPKLRKLGRENFEFAYEPLDSFQTHVYDGLFGRSERRANAAEVLGCEPDASPREVKSAHRKLMMELHPDRFIGDEEGAEEARARMLKVQDAYGEMGGGQGSGSGSWYASVGGKARVDFSGVLPKADLGPLGRERDAQSLPLDADGWRAAVFPFEPKVTLEFITRNVGRQG